MAAATPASSTVPTRSWCSFPHALRRSRVISEKLVEWGFAHVIKPTTSEWEAQALAHAKALRERDDRGAAAETTEENTTAAGTHYYYGAPTATEAFGAGIVVMEPGRARWRAGLVPQPALAKLLFDGEEDELSEADRQILGDFMAPDGAPQAEFDACYRSLRRQHTVVGVLPHVREHYLGVDDFFPGTAAAAGLERQQRCVGDRRLAPDSNWDPVEYGVDRFFEMVGIRGDHWSVLVPIDATWSQDRTSRQVSYDNDQEKLAMFLCGHGVWAFSFVFKPEIVADYLGCISEGQGGGVVVVDIGMDATVISVVDASSGALVSSAVELVENCGVEVVGHFLGQAVDPDQAAAFDVTASPRTYLVQDEVWQRFAAHCVCRVSPQDPAPATIVAETPDDVKTLFPAAPRTLTLSPSARSDPVELAFLTGDPAGLLAAIERCVGSAATALDSSPTQLVSNIVLVGGGALIPGLGARIEKEMAKNFPKACVRVPEQPDTVAFRAASDLASRFMSPEVLATQTDELRHRNLSRMYDDHNVSNDRLTVVDQGVLWWMNHTDFDEHGPERCARPITNLHARVARTATYVKSTNKA
jgi:Actin